MARCHVQLPASKSLSNRLLMIRAIAGCTTMPQGMAQCDDTSAMIAALGCDSTYINVGGAGTAMRFLTAYFAALPGREVVLDGDERMRQRPIAPLVDVLHNMGASIDYAGTQGFPPLRIAGRKLSGGIQSIDGSVSSQFVSALLMIAPVCGGLTLKVEGGAVSRPYIDMTLQLMARCGVDARWHGTTIVVPARSYNPAQLSIEGDWSAAAFWFSMQALLPQSAIKLLGLERMSLQGDSAIVELMKPLGVETCFGNDMVSLGHNGLPLPARYERDMSATPDLVPALAVTLCLLRVPFTLTGLQSLRVKESDRIEALRQELAKLGYSTEAEGSSLSYAGSYVETTQLVALDSHADHRMAMALSLAATRHGTITIKAPQVVAKSYPQWWTHLTAAGFKIEKTEP